MTPDGGTSPDDQVAAREAAVEEREQAADDRETALELRESRVEAVLAGAGDRGEITRRILDEAEHRDLVSDARDVDADERENAASRAAFLSQNQSSQQPGVRRAAALDRRHSKSDRASAATDRVELAGEDAATDETPSKD